MPKLDTSDIIKIDVVKMLHNESRKLLVEAYEKTHNAKKQQNITR